MTAFACSNNTNKLSPQELRCLNAIVLISSNNTNKLSPQELKCVKLFVRVGSNNTNKLSPQEPVRASTDPRSVQIIQINLALKNRFVNHK